MALAARLEVAATDVSPAGGTDVSPVQSGGKEKRPGGPGPNLPNLLSLPTTTETDQAQQADRGKDEGGGLGHRHGRLEAESTVVTD